MKNILSFSKAFFVVLFSLVFVTCGKAEDFRHALPADAFMTFGINPSSLYKKAEVGDIRNTLLYSKVYEELNDTDLSVAEKEFLMGLLANPEKSGIDTDHDFYMFVSMDENASMYDPEPSVGVLARMKDRGKFDQVIEFAAKIEESDLEVRNEGEITFVLVDDSDYQTVTLAYNDDAALLFVNPDSYNATVSKVRRMFAQKQSESLLASNDVRHILSGDDDIKGLFQLGNAPQEMLYALSSMPMFDVFKRIAYGGVMNFEKGNITSKFEVVASKSDKKELENLYSYMKPQSGELLKYLPEENILALGSSFNGSKMYETVLSMPQGAMLALVPQVKQVMDAIDGDMIMGLSGIETYGYRTMPVGTIIMSVNNGQAVQEVFELLGAFDFEPNGENEYKMDMYGMDVYFGLKGDKLYATNDERTMAVLNGSNIRSLEGKRDLFRGKTGSFLMDFNAITAMIIAQAGDELEYDNELGMVFRGLSMFDTMEAVSDEGMDGRMDVKMKDRSQNAAKTIYDFFAVIVKDMMD